MTPREELVYQMRDTMREVCGPHNVGVLKSGEHWRRDLPIQVISWPTMLARTARDEMWFPDVDTLAIDECHLALSRKMVERILPYYADRTEVFGVTATPARKSGHGLGNFFTEIKNVISVRQLVKMGRLAPLEYWGGSIADTTGVRSTHGDFNAKQLSDKLMVLVGDVVDNWGRLAADRHTLVFACDIAHCEALAERFQKAGVAAVSLHQYKTPDERRRIVKAFRERVVQVIVNVGIASYGFDVPSVDCVVLARPTKSLVLHLQMIGRAMRVCEGKEFGMILDHGGNVRRHGQADDLFRWKLDRKSIAATNWSRHEANEKKEELEDKSFECKTCGLIFSRSRVCPKCGESVPLPKIDREAIDADLVRLSKRKKDGQNDWPENRVFYLMLRHYQENKRYKVGWARHKYREKVGKWPGHWDSLETIEPSVRVANWIRSRQIAYAKSKEKKEAAA